MSVSNSITAGSADDEQRSVLRPCWVVLPTPLALRTFFGCGIVDRLRSEFGAGLTLCFARDGAGREQWLQRAGDTRVLLEEDLFPYSVPFASRVARRADIWLDRRIGLFPLGLRHSLRHGFNVDRMQPGHKIPYLDLDRLGPLPRWRFLDPLMMRWHYGRLRYVSHSLLDALREERPLLVLGNTQTFASAPFVLAAKRLGLPVVGYIASWDHAVGKGVVPPHIDRYLVQNDIMRDDLCRYHGIPSDRVDVTGWPTSDVYHRRRSRDEYEALLDRLGVDATKPVVFVVGNVFHNAPYEHVLLEHLSEWASSPEKRARFSLLFRPHPHDREWRSRYAAALDRGVAAQEATYADLDDLTVLLQHAACVVAHAGTVLLDAIANDRPSVCVLYDEGAPDGERLWAEQNVTGKHYAALVDSGCFYPARSFEQVADGVERALSDPGEQHEERVRATERVMGTIDGCAAERVVDAIVRAAR